MVTSAFLFEDSFPDDSAFNKCIATAATLYLFFFGNYLMNFMSSELIVFPSPDIIKSYNDIVEWNAQGRKVTIVFPPGLPESEKFALAPKGSLMNRLWNLRTPFDFSLGTVGILSKIPVSLQSYAKILLVPLPLGDSDWENKRELVASMLYSLLMSLLRKQAIQMSFPLGNILIPSLKVSF